MPKISLVFSWTNLIIRSSIDRVVKPICNSQFAITFCNGDLTPTQNLLPTGAGDLNLHHLNKNYDKASSQAIKRNP